MRKSFLAAALSLLMLPAATAFAQTEGESNTIQPTVFASGFGPARASAGFIASGQYNNADTYGDDHSPAATTTRRAVSQFSRQSVTYGLASSNG